ncbi:tyrosine-type recombinase/integrase, partial [Phocaeicola plebeius]|uniref:tyrosine-type recombinase/integrase n=1 Tax=Phocaeicola plebeius TaxID=310297 RepID=UPI00266CCD19
LIIVILFFIAFLNITYTARHTCASRLINRDIPVTTIQKVIGHRQISMTMIYAKINDNAFVRQLQKL